MTGTRKLLLRQLSALVLLTALATAAMFKAYHEVHRHPHLVRDRTAPALMKVAAARTALMGAHRAAQVSLGSGLTDIVYTGEAYDTRIAAATQNLSQIADRQVAGEAGERTLSTVNALLTVYTEAVDQAVRHADRPALSEAWFASADAVLNRGETGILFRLDELQDRQRRELAAQTSFGGTRRALWLTTTAVVLLLAGTLLVVQWQLYRRFPQRLNPWLLAACVLVLCAAFPALWTERTQQQLQRAHAELETVLSAQQGTRAGPDWTERETLAMRKQIEQAGAWVTRTMDDTAGRAGAIDAVLLAGGAVALLAGAGLSRHLVQYRAR